MGELLNDVIGQFVLARELEDVLRSEVEVLERQGRRYRRIVLGEQSSVVGDGVAGAVGLPVAVAAAATGQAALRVDDVVADLAGVASQPLITAPSQQTPAPIPEEMVM